MKIILIMAIFLTLTGKIALAERAMPDINEENFDYLSKDVVKLSEREKKSLRLSKRFFDRGPEPVIVENGKLMYVHGASTPTILASPMQVCDVELEKGEEINEIIVGDSARWMVETGSSGSGNEKIVHLFIKPVDAGLETTAIVTTNRRTYHLRLVSQRENHTPYVGFSYPNSFKRSIQKPKKYESIDKDSTDSAGKKADLAKLNFAYKIKGSASWKPLRIYDNGQQIYIVLPNNISEMPVLLAQKGSKNIMVNYRINGQTMVVDGLFDKIALILGIGSNKEEIKILRDSKI